MKARDNPFRVERLHGVRYRFPHGNLDDLLRDLAAHDWHGAIVGPHGSGKTTLLDELQHRLRSDGRSVSHLRLTEHNRDERETLVACCLRTSQPDDILLLDGAEQLGPWEWRRFRKESERFAGLVITTHREGRLPTLWRTSTSPQLFREIVKELAGPDAAFSAAELDKLFQKHRGNIRDCLRELYELAR